MSIVLQRGTFFGETTAEAASGSIRVAETRYARGAYLPRHRHEDTYLTFVLSGGYEEHCDAGTRTCSERSLVFHPAGDTHEDDFAARTTRCLNVVLAAGFVDRLGDVAEPLHRGGVVTAGLASHTACLIRAELRQADAAAFLVIEGLLLELFGTLARASAPRKERPDWLHEAEAIVTREFARNLTLSAVAARVGVHPAHLARAFRQRYGLSVGERIRTLRLEWARHQIARGTALAAIAADGGFTDQSHFTKAFTRAFGVAPSEYRRRLRRSH